jgi:hypothetical protein
VSHEQFHAEFKPDMDLNRLPSGKFATNHLVCALAAVAMNLLRIMGQHTLHERDSPLRKAALRRRIVRECLARNVRVRIGIGGNPVDALVRAHGGGSVDEAPVEALRIDAETVESLHAVNVRRIGELRALPKPALLARYGMPLLARLEMLEGTRRQALVPVRERPLPAASLECDGPVLDAEAVRKACATLLGQVCVQLADRRRGARELRIECSLAGRQRACIGIILKSERPWWVCIKAPNQTKV